jgi:endonuclease III
LLRETYGISDLGNPPDPLDDLIFIILSNKTGPSRARKTYEMIKTAYPNWEDVVQRPIEDLQSILRPSGLSLVKSQQIYRALQKIKTDFGECDLWGLEKLSTAEAQDYLTSLAGVSEKVAKCVLMYTLHREVLPVDSHVHRIAKRLGWTARKRADQSHLELEALVPGENRFAFHVNCIMHGRVVCRAIRPLCDKCIINNFCDYFQLSIKKMKGNKEQP